MNEVTISLGPILNSDATPIFNWWNSSEVMSLNGSVRPTSQVAFDEWFRGIGKDPSRIVLAIRVADPTRFVGYVQIANINAASRSAELSIMIGETTERGRKYGQRALLLAKGFAWQELNLQRLSLSVLSDNVLATRAYLKAGFEVEGILRRAVYINGVFKDLMIMACLNG